MSSPSTQTQTQTLDATEIFCPDLSLSVRRFLNGLSVGQLGHVVTKEPRAENRLKHICSSFEWELKTAKQGEYFHFIVDKNPSS